jgi:type II secretory pathway pseudopilin PulG
MWRFTVPKSEAGITAIELLIVIVIVGILSSISVPSFMAMLNRTKVNNAFTSIQGALKEAQREAMRKSQRCTVTLSATGVSSTDGCLPTGDRTFDEGVVLSHNGGATIRYGIRGNTTAMKTMTVYYTSNGEVMGTAKCLVISSPLGIVRTGSYNGNPTTSIDSDNCNF